MKKCMLLLGFILLPAFSDYGAVSGSSVFPEHLLSAKIAPVDRSGVGAVAVSASRARLVLLGEATHGTKEFYEWRDMISRSLIGEYGFSFIAVEGDWASIHRVNRYVKGLPGAASSAREALFGRTRWPRWMWENEEFESLAEWLRIFNADRPPEERVGLYGMDLYAPWDSADKLLAYVHENFPGEVLYFERGLGTFLGFREDVSGYVRGAYSAREELDRGYASLIGRIRGLTAGMSSHEALFVEQKLHVVRNAHAHYMAMADSLHSSWNPRAVHMHETVQRLLKRYGEGSRGIVWAHNTHIGDARATSMAARGEVNIGQLSRQVLGDRSVFALGFATARGSVLAGRSWGGEREVMSVPQPGEGSLDALLDELFPEGAVLGWTYGADELSSRTVHQRAIGVIYHPERENPGNYVPSVLGRRYDAMVFLPETGILNPW